MIFLPLQGLASDFRQRIGPRGQTEDFASSANSIFGDLSISNGWIILWRVIKQFESL
jgi:hypothetical protein